MDNTGELAYAELHACDSAALCQMSVSIMFGLLIQLYWQSVLLEKSGSKFAEQRIIVKCSVKLDENVTGLRTE